MQGKLLTVGTLTLWCLGSLIERKRGRWLTGRREFRLHSMSTVVLYSYWRSSCSHRIRIILALKNIPYEYKVTWICREESRPVLWIEFSVFCFFLCSFRLILLCGYSRQNGFGKAVSLLNLENLSDDYKKTNGMGQVPSLEIDSYTMSQSVVIAEYLEETRPDCRPLLPKDAFRRAIVRRTKYNCISDRNHEHIHLYVFLNQSHQASLWVKNFCV